MPVNKYLRNTTSAYLLCPINTGLPDLLNLCSFMKALSSNMRTIRILDCIYPTSCSTFTYTKYIKQGETLPRKMYATSAIGRRLQGLREQRGPRASVQELLGMGGVPAAGSRTESTATIARAA